MRRVAHVFWRFGIFLKWNFFDKEFNKLIDNIQEDDEIIFYPFFPEPILNIYARIHKKVKIRIWLWDSFSKITEIHNKLNLLKKTHIPIATFDPVDAAAGNIAFIPQLYSFNTPFEPEPTKAVINPCDCYFLGNFKDEHRKTYLDALQTTLNHYHIRAEIYLVGETGRPYLSYTQNLHNLSQCKCLLELMVQGQTGLTLRTMEALAFRKKLITNNQDIKRYSFYRKNNIYIIGEDREETLPAFIESNYEEIPEEILMQYDVNSWYKKIMAVEATPI